MSINYHVLTTHGGRERIFRQNLSLRQADWLLASAPRAKVSRQNITVCLHPNRLLLYKLIGIFSENAIRVGRLREKKHGQDQSQS